MKDRFTFNKNNQNVHYSILVKLLVEGTDKLLRIFKLISITNPKISGTNTSNKRISIGIIVWES